LLGMAWWWLQEHMGSKHCSITIGQQHVHCSTHAKHLQAIRLIASARPETSAPAASGDYILSLLKRSA
jgi:hypothetical protein